MERKFILRIIFYFVASNGIYSVIGFKMSFISACNPNNILQLYKPFQLHLPFALYNQVVGLHSTSMLLKVWTIYTKTGNRFGSPWLIFYSIWIESSYRTANGLQGLNKSQRFQRLSLFHIIVFASDKQMNWISMMNPMRRNISISSWEAFLD